MSPKITIVTVCLNAANYITHTITSVVKQTYQYIEYIIIDGGSTDCTVDIIKKYEKTISKWVSEPDLGISDAMNKGICMATGDYILFLHADDYLYRHDVIEKAINLLDKYYPIVSFNIFFLSSDGSIMIKKPRGFNWWMNFKTGVYHQGAMCHRDVFNKVGVFDIDYRIALDYDFFLRAYRASVRAKRYNYPLVIMRDTGISSSLDWPTLQQRFAEEKRIHEKNCGSAVMRLVYFLYWQCYPRYRNLRHLLAMWRSKLITGR